MPEQKDSGKIKTTLSGNHILDIKAGGAHYLHIIHALPRMLFLILFPGELTNLVHKLQLQMRFVLHMAESAAPGILTTCVI